MALGEIIVELVRWNGTLITARTKGHFFINETTTHKSNGKL